VLSGTYRRKGPRINNESSSKSPWILLLSFPFSSIFPRPRLNPTSGIPLTLCYVFYFSSFDTLVHRCIEHVKNIILTVAAINTQRGNENATRHFRRFAVLSDYPMFRVAKLFYRRPRNRSFARASTALAARRGKPLNVTTSRQRGRKKSCCKGESGEGRERRCAPVVRKFAGSYKGGTAAWRRKEDSRPRVGRGGRKDGEKKSRKTDLENPADRFCVRVKARGGESVCAAVACVTCTADSVSQLFLRSRKTFIPSFIYVISSVGSGRKVSMVHLEIYRDPRNVAAFSCGQCGWKYDAALR